MKKIYIVFFLLVVLIAGIYFGGRRGNEASVNKTITLNGETIKRMVHKSSENSGIDVQNPISAVSKENVGDELETSKRISSNNIYNSSFWTGNVDDLVTWIKNADNSDERKHFLEYARKKKKILVAESKNNGYKLKSIMVPPDYEYMTYTFSKGEKYISININLSDSMKQQMSAYEKNNTIEKVMSYYNKELKKTYKDFQYKKDEFEILNKKVPIYYNDGKYYEKQNGETRLISPGAFFEIEDIEVRMTLYAELKEQKWNNKYLNLFEFKVIELV